MFLTKKHLSRRTLLKGAGVSLALPLLDAMIPAATALSQTAAAQEAAHGILLHSSRRDHGQHVPWREDGQLDAQRFGCGLQARSDHEVARTYKKYVTSFGNLKNDAMVGGVHSRASRNLAERGEAGARRPAPKWPRLSIRSLPTISVRARHCRHWNWLRRRRFRRRLAAALAAITARRCRSATRHSRCRWNSIRVRFSSSCLAKGHQRGARCDLAAEREPAGSHQ